MVDSPPRSPCGGAVLSYQSARSGWKVLFVLAVVVTASPAHARPYVDERRGFSLELTDEWIVAPQFGETEAMIFERRFSARRGRRRAALSVRRVDGASDTQVQAELQRVWGSAIGPGQPFDASPPGGRFLWSLLFEPSVTRTAEAHLLRVGSTRFLIGLQASRRDLARVRREAAALVRTFRSRSPPAPRPTIRAKAPARRPKSGGAPKGFVGRWIRPDGAALVLASDGAYRLAEIEGRYELRGDRLHLSRPDGGTQVFRAQRTGDRLELSAPGLDVALVFRRFRPEVALSGRWTTKLPKGTLVLVLRRDFRFALGAHEGTWRTAGDRLILEKSKTERITYMWVLSDGVLTLSGSDLDTPLKLTR